MKILLFIIFVSTNIYANYSQLLFNGNCITCHKTDESNKSAPTIMEIKQRYKNAFPKKEDFITYMSIWVLEPKKETSIMHDAIDKYNLMPNLAYDKQTLEEISEYIFNEKFNK